MSALSSPSPAWMSSQDPIASGSAIRAKDRLALVQQLETRVRPMVFAAAKGLAEAGFCTHVRCCGMVLALRAYTPGRRVEAWFTVALAPPARAPGGFCWRYLVKRQGLRHAGRAGRPGAVHDLCTLGVVTAEFMDLCAGLVAQRWIGRLPC